MKQHYLTPAEVEVLLHIPGRVLRLWIRQGSLPQYTTINGVLIKTPELEQLLKLNPAMAQAAADAYAVDLIKRSQLELEFEDKPVEN